MNETIISQTINYQGDKADNYFTESEIAALKRSSMGPKPYHPINKAVQAISQLEDRLDIMMKNNKIRCLYISTT